MIYTVQPDTPSLHPPTIKQGLLVTNGPHTHGIAVPRDPALICRPLELIHPLLAAQVGADKSAFLESRLQGHPSVEIEDRLESLNFMFYRNSWPRGATDPITLGKAWLPLHQHGPPAK